MKENTSVLGVFSALATFGLMATVAWKMGSLGVVVNDLVAFLSGRVGEVAIGQMSFLAILPLILAVVVLELPCSISAAFFPGLLLGKHKGHEVSNILSRMEDGNHFFNFFVAVIMEELFARWFFLGFLAQTKFLSGTIAFYALLLIGNAIWSLFHLANYERECDRKFLRVLPQFVAGIFFSYIYVKCGLIAVILAHFASNAVIFSISKVQRVSIIDGLMIGYGVLCAYISYRLMSKPIADVALWFADNPTFALAGWGFWDYVKISVFSSSCCFVLFSSLLYDRGEAGKNLFDEDFVEGILKYILGTVIIVTLLYGGYFLLGQVVENVLYRVLFLAIIFCFIHTSASGSAVSRVFWSSLPSTYIMVCIMQALGFWPALGWITVTTVIFSPQIVLNKFDD